MFDEPPLRHPRPAAPGQQVPQAAAEVGTAEQRVQGQAEPHDPEQDLRRLHQAVSRSCGAATGRARTMSRSTYTVDTVRTV